MRLLELENTDKEAKKLSSKKLPESWENIEEIFYYQSLLYFLKVIWSELINKHHNNLLTSYFGIKKTWELIARKYHWFMLEKAINIYVKGCDICLVLKTISYKPYGNFQSLLIPTH